MEKPHAKANSIRENQEEFLPTPSSDVEKLGNSME